MEPSPAYLKERAELLQEGFRRGFAQGFQQGFEQGFRQGLEQVVQWRTQQGLKQGKRLMLEALLRTRFGELDEALLGIVDSLLQLSPDEVVSLCVECSREELLAQLGERP